MPSIARSKKKSSHNSDHNSGHKKPVVRKTVVKKRKSKK